MHVRCGPTGVCVCSRPEGFCLTGGTVPHDNRDSAGCVPHNPAPLSAEHAELYGFLEKLTALQATRAPDLEGALRDVNAISVEAVPGARHAGITRIDKQRKITTLGATHAIPGVLDGIQQAVGEGPCLSAAWTQHVIRIDDLSAEDRWPLYRREALAQTPVRSLLSFRLFDNGTSLGALNFTAESPDVFDDESVELGLIYAAHTAVAWNIMARERQFQSALASRDVIGQAKGMLMERFGIDAAAAFDLLRRLSQESNAKLVDIATKLVSADPPQRLS
jgi:hypothetical protein